MITVIVLYDDALCEHYVSVQSGQLSEAKKQEIGSALEADINGAPNAHREEGRTVSFVECQDGDKKMYNIWKEAST
jgi:hypothetical protein